MLVLYRLDSYSSVIVCFDIKKYESSNFLFFFTIVVAIGDPLPCLTDLSPSVLAPAQKWLRFWWEACSLGCPGSLCVLSAQTLPWALSDHELVGLSLWGLFDASLSIRMRPRFPGVPGSCHQVSQAPTLTLPFPLPPPPPACPSLTCSRPPHSEFSTTNPLSSVVCRVPQPCQTRDPPL